MAQSFKVWLCAPFGFLARRLLDSSARHARLTVGADVMGHTEATQPAYLCSGLAQAGELL